jgi:hypothetical protein
MVRHRFGSANCSTDRHQDRVLDAGTAHGGLTVLQTLNQTSDLVFANKIGEVMVGYRKSWLKIVKLGDLPDDITPHGCVAFERIPCR